MPVGVHRAGCCGELKARYRIPLMNNLENQ